jgi:hypothetical protein
MLNPLHLTPYASKLIFSPIFGRLGYLRRGVIQNRGLSQIRAYSQKITSPKKDIAI